MNQDDPNDEAVEVYLKASGADAEGRLNGSRITVVAGSRGRASEVPSVSESVQRRRQELLGSGAFRVDGDVLLVEVDHEFDSPSGAAMALMGRQANGWREWRLADGTPIDQLRNATPNQQENSFRHRWYEAHLIRFEADAAALSAGLQRQENFAGSAAEALSLLDSFDAERDMAVFAAGLQQWAVKPTTLAFNGFSGQMLVNQLAKRSEGNDEVAEVLVDALRVPVDLSDAVRKIDRLVEYIEQIRVGAHPAPGHAPFLASYFWALRDHDSWPTIWASAASFAEYCAGEALPASPAQRYERYHQVAAELDDDFRRFERTAIWWEDTKPVVLDSVLVDRCEWGWEVGALPVGVWFRNADTLVRVEQHVGPVLTPALSSALGRPVNAKWPNRLWNTDHPRSDMWVDWRAHESGLGLRLWIGKIGMTIGLVPGQGREGWRDEVMRAIESAPVAGFEMVGCRDRPVVEGGRAHGSGNSGDFQYARFYDRTSLDELDVESEFVAVAVALKPLIDRALQLVGGETVSGDPLASFVKRFNEESPPSAADREQSADRQRFAELLAPDRIALADPAEMRVIWNTGRYGGPGVMPSLNRSIRDADAAEYDRIIDAFRYLCWGDDPDEVRIDRLLTDPQYKVTGLGESVILKLLAICHPDRYIPTFPYSGPHGKRAMLMALGLPEPDGSRGEMQVASNDALRARLEPFFPNDPWRMMVFLYWYIEGGGGSVGRVTDLVDPLDELAEELLVDRSSLDDIVALLEDKGQVIFYGPPGTGKTYLARRLSEVLAADATRRSLVQFHPSTSYEDFFEGYRPEDNDEGSLTYRLTRGPLALIAQRALSAPGKRHVMVIDELNRANLPRVFGELLFLLEYRNESVRTLYRPEDTFELPSNLWFIGTMNTADRSIALVDAALRRRFHFIPFFPNVGPMAGLLERWLAKNGEPAWVGELVAMVNDQLTAALGGPHLQIGPSYFMKQGLDVTLMRRIWAYNIEPFIEDQFFGDADQIASFRFQAVLAEYLRSVEAESLEHLEELRAADPGAAPPVPAPDVAEVEDVTIAEP